MQNSAPLPPELDPRGFLVSEAYAAGIPRWRLESSDLVTPSRGLRLIRGLSTDLEHRVRLHTSVAQRCAASNVTSALLWPIPLPLGLENESHSRDLIHLTRRAELGRVKRRGVVGHRAPLLDRDVRCVNGVVLTSPEWTWVDLAHILGRDALVAAGDALLKRRNPLSTLDRIREVVDRRHKVKGIRLAREVLPLLRHGVDSPQESKLRLKIIDAGLPEPAITHGVLDDAGKYVSTPDLQYKEYRIAMEYEGDHHRRDPVQWGWDIERDDRLRSQGWIVLRFSSFQLREGWPASERKIRQALAERGWRLPSS